MSSLIVDPPIVIPQSPRTTPRGEINTANQNLEALVNDEGMIPDIELARWPTLFETWTHSRLTASGDSWSPRACDRYQKLLGQMLRLMRFDGSFAFGFALPNAHVTTSRAHRSAVIEFWKAVVSYADADQRVILAALFPETAKNARAAASARKKIEELPGSAAHCEAAGLAVLRPTWSPREMLTVDYRGREIRSELVAGGQVVWSGGCNPRVSLDGVDLSPISDWEQLCWVSDDDADYLELQLELSGGVRVQRQMLLARQDHFLFAADAVLGERPATIDYQLALPLTEGVAFSPTEQTHEGFLATTGRRRASVLPLALSEWRSDARSGKLEVDLPADAAPVGDDLQGRLPAERRPGSPSYEPRAAARPHLKLELTAPSAHALYAPLFVDLSSRRLSRPATWRQLTVGENRVIQPSDVAVGYRVQIGREQWLFYRSLAECGNRTLLGQNLVSEFLAARFGRSGVAEALMEIEATPDE